MAKFIVTLVVPPSSLAKSFRLRVRNRLTWTTDHPSSHYGFGVLVDTNGEILDGFNFRRLRAVLGAMIETKDPLKVCQALGVPAGETGVVDVRS